ncbi:choice-of-anchor X domain-containing protein [Curvibacter sp. APW13]|uniref:choice-of-anchor X domain-containing protein n=1 Tax=Curvibacter sp. APW13 TaxID=3077236 RepID=UPI0028DE3145|nr:choice-of-anchor X domain-containing protein [Curvibacter sp. APW13]MDT8991628.1 choice-of-anchor X domain-containing protein [Curvibacter sp. APW13]
MRRSTWAALGGGAVLAVMLGWWLLPAEDAGTVGLEPSTAPATSAARHAAADTGAGAAAAVSTFGSASRQEQLRQARERYERATQVYTSYRDATRYPHDSRPISEHADQTKPFAPVEEFKALRDASGKGVKGIRLRTSQDRVFLSGAESVLVSIEATDDSGRPVPLSITRSQAQTVADTSTPVTLISAEVPFNDDGVAPDISARDGKYTARLTPSTQGFAAYAGTIRILAQISANGETGAYAFDVIYSPNVPATWVGAREVQENGSLNFYLKAQIREPGRYVVSGRVYDANGKPFALLQFNDEVKVGMQEFKLNLFGALIRDKAPAFPLSLVDVDGFLLKENAFPDRAMMARQSGVVITSKRYAVSSFSAAEWSSEERERYLREYGKDMQAALDALNRLQ